MIDSLGAGTLAAIVGLLSGLLLGLAARLGRFCTLGAIEDWLYGDNATRLRMWAVAIGVAVIGSFGAGALGWADIGQSFYLTLAWNPLASILGGLVFGYGMAIAGNCGYGALARLGGGDLRSFVIVVVMGIAAYVTISGPLAYPRIWAFPTVAATGTTPGIAHGLEALTRLPAWVFGIAIGAAILAATLPRMRHDRAAAAWGAVVGLAVAAAWIGTSWIAHHSMGATPVVSHTFARPLGETILYAMTASGMPLTFAVGSVAGVWIGAFIGSLIKGHFRWEACEDPRELRRQIFGAALMGVGGVVAVGCSIGQGLSAFSVLAWSAPVTLAAIFAGAAFGLRQLIAGFQPAE
ncbi:MAG: sulfur transporter SoxT [Rhodobacteraceae bacterium HLUCCA08]|nr:MAG: sulfur transporter SoxT [Rhodobacteraceae bacterium HLUCCA08]